jgi:hypothetical protein
MMNSGTMSDMIREMMEQKQERSGQPEFILPGEEASPIMYESETGRTYVIYEDEEGGRNKIFGDWEQFIAGEDDNGNEMIAPEQYPISKDQDGNYVLNEEAFEEMNSREVEEEEEEADDDYQSPMMFI